MVQIAQESGNVVPLIDGGTEGQPRRVLGPPTELTLFTRIQRPIKSYPALHQLMLRVYSGSALAALWPAAECQMSLITPATAYPICTIANTPRLPEHCIEWASVLEWPKVFKGECHLTIPGRTRQKLTEQTRSWIRMIPTI